MTRNAWGCGIIVVLAKAHNLLVSGHYMGVLRRQTLTPSQINPLEKLQIFASKTQDLCQRLPHMKTDPNSLTFALRSWYEHREKLDRPC